MSGGHQERPESEPVAGTDMRSRSFMLSLMLPFIKRSIRKRQGGDLERFKRLLEAGELSA